MISPSQSEVQVTATGYVVPQRTSKVGAKIPGRIAKVFVKEGDTVKEGDVIARLEDADQKSAIVAAGSRVGVAKAHISTAKAHLAEISQQVKRERALVASGAVGQSKLDDLLAREAALREAVKVAEAETRSARAEASTYGVGLKDRMIVAPLGGRIVGKPATVGEFVGGAGNVAPLAEVVDFTSLMVEVDVPEARLHLVKVDGPAEIVLDAYPNKRYRGVTAELGQRVNRAKATIVVKVKFEDDADGVLPEMSARVSFLSKPAGDLDEPPKKVVKSDAVVERDGKKVVFAVDSGKLRLYPVKVGAPVGDSSVELLDGPPPGTRVVSTPDRNAAEGQSIKEAQR